MTETAEAPDDGIAGLLPAVPAELSQVRAAAGRAGGLAGRGTPKRYRGVPGFRGPRLAGLRRERGLDQAALGARVGLSRYAICRYEAEGPGSRKPDRQTLLELVAALNRDLEDPGEAVSVADLVDMTELAQAEPETARELAGLTSGITRQAAAPQ